KKTGLFWGLMSLSAIWYWGNNQPDNNKNEGNENCALNVRGIWNDLSCNKNNCFVCEKLLK
uniref:C-type lectin domain-containing protein n=1 Tax=Scophthalmus maximus TaxID=52904 RepID=A0A8D3B6P5_SCOMX